MNKGLKYLLFTTVFVCFSATNAALADKTHWDKYTDAGLAAFGEGRWVEVESAFSLALKEAEKFGPADPRLVTSLNNLAGLYMVQRKLVQPRYSEAELLFKRALAIREKALGPNHPDVAQSLDSLAWSYQVQGKYAEAEPLYKRSLAIREKVLRPNHKDVAISLEAYAELLRKTDRKAEASKLDIRAKAIWAAQK